MDAADLMAVALLAEPTRQRLYLYLRERHEPVGREEAARQTGVKPRLAAFHLDRMAEAGLLDVEFRRLSGRVGPGAGRPAKVYSISSRSFSVEVPQTRYGLAASMMATAMSAGGPRADGAASLQDVATAVGESLGCEIRHLARTKGARQEAVRGKLRQLGYEPQVQESGEWKMRNCIFSELSISHREVVCPMNAALVTGMLNGAHLSSLHVESGPTRPGCCVRVASK
jgi:predicted ArsR family transcriptional regulator